MSEAPRYKGDPWRAACPECGSMSVHAEYVVGRRETIYDCKVCYARDIEPIDRKAEVETPP